MEVGIVGSSGDQSVGRVESRSFPARSPLPSPPNLAYEGDELPTSKGLAKKAYGRNFGRGAKSRRRGRG